MPLHRSRDLLPALDSSPVVDDYSLRNLQHDMRYEGTISLRDQEPINPTPAPNRPRLTTGAFSRPGAPLQRFYVAINHPQPYTGFMSTTDAPVIKGLQSKSFPEIPAFNSLTLSPSRPATISSRFALPVRLFESPARTTNASLNQRNTSTSARPVENG